MSSLRDVYAVEFSLGSNSSNVVLKLNIVGYPTVEKVREILVDRLNSAHLRITLATGLPDSEFFLILSQCLYLLDTFGLLETGLAIECINQNPEFSQFMLGHISMAKINEVYVME